MNEPLIRVTPHKEVREFPAQALNDGFGKPILMEREAGGFHETHSHPHGSQTLIVGGYGNPKGYLPKYRLIEKASIFY
jgi:hypothetical protein